VQWNIYFSEWIVTYRKCENSDVPTQRGWIFVLGYYAV